MKTKKEVAKPKVEELKISKQGSKAPVTYQEHLDAGFVDPQTSEGLQLSGEVVTEIKIIEGKTLHKLKGINKCL